MKANELMPGNYVTFKDCQQDTSPTIVKIWQINADNEAFVSIDGNDALDEISIDDEIVGIPLTPEILEKNGFGYIENDWEIIHFYPGEQYFCKDMDLHIGNYKAVFWLNTFRNTIYGIYFVHQLQQALRLCGIEKEIIL